MNKSLCLPLCTFGFGNFVLNDYLPCSTSQRICPYYQFENSGLWFSFLSFYYFAYRNRFCAIRFYLSLFLSLWFLLWIWSSLRNLSLIMAVTTLQMRWRNFNVRTPFLPPTIKHAVSTCAQLDWSKYSYLAAIALQLRQWQCKVVNVFDGKYLEGNSILLKILIPDDNLSNTSWYITW